MARINDITKYPYDYNITDKDFIIGTDGDNKKTKNFPVIALAEYVRNFDGDLSYDRIISIGEINSENNIITINVNDLGNVVYINNRFYTKNTPDTFTFTPVTEGVKVILLYALPDEQIFYMLEGVQSDEAVEPILPAGALFVRRIIATEQGLNIDDIQIIDEKVQITENTYFASIGQYQKQFNQAVSNWRNLVDSNILNLENNFLNYYNKNEIYNLMQGISSGYKGDLIKTDPAPIQAGFYGLLETGIYTNLGGINAIAGNLNLASFDGTTWSLISIDLPAGENFFSETDATSVATMKPTADFVKEKIAEKIEDEINRDNLHEFVDKQKKRFAYFDANGKLYAYFSDEVLDRLRELKEDESTDAFRFVDKANRIVTWIDEDGFLNAKINDLNPDKTTGLSMLSRYPYDAEKGDLELLSMTMISDVCTITTVAKGRNSTASSNDAPTFALSNQGSTAHPSVIYFPQKWNGKKYWMAFTPHFGTINTLQDYVQYENPHIMCSDDGINWTEPLDHFGNKIQNPLAQPINAQWAAANSSFGYYSDTHIEMGDDGYMYLYYRGNYMPYPTITDPNKVVFIVMRKSRDGVNWSEPVLIKSTTDADVDNGSGMVSPAIVNINGTWNYYDVAYSTATHPYTPDNAQEGKFTFRMSGNSPDNFELRDASKIVRFDSRPWGIDWEPWHIDVKKFGNLYVMVINAGLKNKSNGEGLFLAYSGDGWNWKCLPDALFSNVTYRSSIILKDFNNDILTFWLYRGRKDNGKIELHELKLKYNN